MKKGFLFLTLTVFVLISLVGAGIEVWDVTRSDGAGIAKADTFEGVFKGAVTSATSDITVDDITCNTITPDTILGLVLFADSIKDLRIAKGYELSVDSAVIDTAVIALGTISVLVGTNGSFSDSCFAETLGVNKAWAAKASFSDSVKANASVAFLGGAKSCYIDSMEYSNGGKDTVWVYVNGVKMIMATEP